jgi:hypothetical protein
MDHARVVVQHADDRRSFVTREIGGETLIVPVTGNVMDLESIYVLNPVASRIWGLLSSPTSSGRLVQIIADEFDVSPQEASRDVDQFLDSLTTRGLIQELPVGA